MRDGVGSKLGQEAPSSQTAGFPLAAACSAPTHLHSGARLAAGTGQFFGHRETQMLWAHLRLLIHLHTRPAHPLPTADSNENIALSGWRGRGEDRMAWEAAVSLLTCFFKELTALE